MPPEGWLTVLVLVCGFVSYTVWFHDYVFDDAYITYRYAQNAAAGNGLVFNPGERILGTSSPLQALLLTVVGLLGIDIAAAGSVLYPVFWTAVAALGARSVHLLGAPWAAPLFAAWTFLGLGNFDSYWGMETALYTFLLLASVHLARTEREAAAGTVAGLALLARYDGGISALVLAALIAWRRRRFPWRYAAAGTAVVLPWLVFAHWSYGSFLPQTLSAKAGTTDTLGYLAALLQRHITVSFPLVSAFGRPFQAPVLTGLFGFLVAGGVFAGGRRLLRADPWFLHHGITAALLWVGYGVIGPPTAHHWHLAPAAVLAGLFCLGCWAAVLRRPLAPAGRGTSRPAALAAGLCLALVALIPIAAGRSGGRAAEDMYRSRTLAYAEMADWLVRRDLDDLTVLTAEPGYLAYLSGNPVVDLAGLVTEGLYFHGPEERRTSFQEGIELHDPGLVVLHPNSAPGGGLGSYVDVFSAFANRRMVMRRDLFEERFEDLSRPRRLVRQPENVLRGEWRIEPSSDLEELRRLDAFLPDPTRVKVGGRPMAAFATRWRYSPWEAMETPPFLVDFDRLELEFFGTQGTRTVAQLVIDGRVMLQVPGLEHWSAGPTNELQTVAWPMERWRGQAGRVRFVDAGRNDHRVLFTSVRSLRDEHDVWEDFEDDPRPDRWSEPPPRPTPWRTIALDRGLLAPAVGRAASTLGAAGPVEHQTFPFTLPASMSLVLYDACPSQRCVVQLLVKDVVRRELRLSGDGLTATVWGMQRLEGRPGVLRLLDHDPAPDRGFAIDDISFRVPPESRR